LECPSCTQTVRIQPIGGELVRANSDRDSVTDESKIAELTPDTSSKPENTGGTTAAVSHQNEVDELTSKVEKQQQELELLRERMTVQEENIEEIPHVALARIENLEQKVEWATGEINRLIPRVEALTEVSDLDERGICPNCGDELTVERTFTDFVGSSDIQCRGCGRVLSTQT
jgi:predicted RNase H-like nuclease (RuvC/YqgF family)